MKYRNLCGALCAGLLILSSAAASATPVLESRLGGLAYYDPVANLTWLADANYANTSGYSTANGGAMTWSAANTWADNLTVDGVSGWTLPTTADPCYSGFNMTCGEMGILFYRVLGGTAGDSITTTHNANYGDFSNVQAAADAAYWSATEIPGYTADAWQFLMSDGYQDAYPKTVSNYAWAVHTGDVGAATVPEPPTLALLGLGLVGMGLVSRKKKARNS